jgi:hypothetical protein
MSTPAKHMSLFALYHNLLNFVLPFVSSLERPNPEIPVTNSTNIVDISGVGLTQFWNLKNHMQDASVLATAHYPETLDRIFVSCPSSYPTLTKRPSQIIGAPNFFPTVWSWIKRWFDPVTVSKIFILSKAEVKPTLEKFMNPQDIPKQYGGTLDFNWGDLPNLDDEARAAIETDGNKGWVPGPCLWLDHKRVVVGSENGKPRRPLEEVAKMKPVVYAADDTEVPVHPERRRSTISNPGPPPQLNGAAAAGTAKLDRIQSENVVPTTTQAAITTAVPPETNIVPAVESKEYAPAPEVVAQPESEAQPAGAATVAPVAAATEAPSSDAEPTPAVPSNIPAENLRTTPEGATVNLPPPSEQHGFPGQTAEYVQSNESLPARPKATTDTQPAATVPTDTAQEAPTGPAAAAAAAVAGATVAAIPQPGPKAAHTTAVEQKVADKLVNGGESVSILPANDAATKANGDIPHPEIMVSSDPAKGLSLENEKVKDSANERPAMGERFVTAAEF